VRVPRPGRTRSYWLREALATDFGEACPPLKGEVTADIAVLGGGFAGMWTAYFINLLFPNTRVVILEADICGGGASGRNGGFVTGWWDELATLVTLFGPDRALAACEAVSAAVPAIGEWCERHGIDAWYRNAGYLAVATSPVQEEIWKRICRLCTSLGRGDECYELDAKSVAKICKSPVFRSGVFLPNAATVQPARLARGLRRVLSATGVQIYENTPVVGVRPGSKVTIATPGGRVLADKAVVALNAWSGRWPAFRRRLVAWASYIVLTPPIPDRLAAMGWVNGEGIADGRSTLHYFRTTPDGRIAFGGGGGQGYGARTIGKSFTHDQDAVLQTARGFYRLFPDLGDVPLEDAWGGPIDISSIHLPIFGTMSRGNVHYACGFSGNGLAPSYVAGQVMAGLAVGGYEAATRLPLVEPKIRKFPPEPIRSLGVFFVRRAILQKDDREDAGRHVPLLADVVARLPRRFGYYLGPG
jgi:glycine/D-amino acid oxidase-like deaminating enzyme